MKKTETLEKKFHTGFAWNLVGSILYEGIKTLHCFLLLSVLTPYVYGFVGSLFSIIYLTTRIADFGATNSIPPFLNLFTKSKQNFRAFLYRYSFLPHFPLILIGAGIVLTISFNKVAFTSPPLYLFVLPTVVILETVRSFFRQLLHSVFKSKRIVQTEITIFILYVAVIWTAYFGFGYPLTLNLIFIPHLADSALALLAFFVLAYRYYKTLPEGTLNLPDKLWKRLTFTKTMNYLIRISRHMFTSNFLTPLFALKFGLKSAGVFYFASTLASMTQAIVRSLVNYSGSALLASLKDRPQSEKREAFALLADKLIKIVAPVIIFLLVNYKVFVYMSKSASLTNITISLTLLYLIISFTDFFFVLYEQFYIIEEASGKLFLFKMLEVATFYGLISTTPGKTLVSTLLTIIIIRLVSFVIIASNAYFNWRIRPRLKPNLKYISICLGLSLLASLFF